MYGNSRLITRGDSPGGRCYVEVLPSSSSEGAATITTCWLSCHWAVVDCADRLHRRGRYQGLLYVKQHFIALILLVTYLAANITVVVMTLGKLFTRAVLFVDRCFNCSCCCCNFLHVIVFIFYLLTLLLKPCRSCNDMLCISSVDISGRVSGS